MSSRRITSTDLVEVTGFSRHRLRSFLKDLPGYSDKQVTARVAREYNRQELTVIAVCCELEDRYGLRREVIAQLVPEIRKALGLPRSVATDALLVVVLNPPIAYYVDGISDVRRGTVLPLNDILNRIDAYLLGDRAVDLNGQRDLDLGLLPIVTTRRLKVANSS
jgi:hypothetical protein